MIKLSLVNFFRLAAPLINFPEHSILWKDSAVPGKAVSPF